MPKMKTKRSAAKRFKATGTGKLKIKKAGMRHILSKRAADDKRPKRATAYVHRSDVRQTKRMLPYL